MTGRIALVIGNSAYEHAPELFNPSKDARAMAESLIALDFSVNLHVDLTNNKMEDAIRKFGGDIREADAALLFFAGHGLQVEGENYLIPVDAELTDRMQLSRRTFRLKDILETMGRRARNSLLFIDACRDNPFVHSVVAGDESLTRNIARGGLAELRPETGLSSFIAFATAPNTVALDGIGPHSPFTQALLDHITMPDASISDMMIEVRRSVRKATGDQQIPWDQSSLQERFFFKLGAQPDSGPGAARRGPQKHEAVYPPFNKRQNDIFVNYSRADHARVEPLLNWLRDAAGLAVASDSTQSGGAERLTELSISLANVRAAIFCVSRDWTGSSAREAEVSLALKQREVDRRYRIIALGLDETEVPAFLGEVSYVDMRTLGAESGVALLHALVPERMLWAHGRRDVYVSRSWHDADTEISDPLCSALVRLNFRLIGDSPDHRAFDPDKRLKHIIDGCGALVALFPYRAEKAVDGFTSKFMVQEVELARGLGRPYLLFAAPGVKIDPALVAGAFDGRIFPLIGDQNAHKRVLADFEEQYKPSPHVAYSFFATSLLKDAPDVNRAISVVEQITCAECLIGRNVEGKHAQEEIIERIRNAEFVLADISANDRNSQIEAGVARGAGRPLHLISRRPPKSVKLSTRFMLRDLEVDWYENALDRIGIIHRIARAYRRRVIHPKVN
jgi:Caspase domain/TIR domain